VHVLGHRERLVGAVVVLMGVLAMRPMLKAGYDTKLALGRDHRGRDARHPDPAVGAADRLWRGGGRVGREALRRRVRPGIMLAALYVGFVIVLAKLRPDLMPPLP
jgi:TRAP-type mannitol/chloroaromatic compound transport system permease large subunit